MAWRKKRKANDLDRLTILDLVADKLQKEGHVVQKIIKKACLNVDGGWLVHIRIVRGLSSEGAHRLEI